MPWYLRLHELQLAMDITHDDNSVLRCDSAFGMPAGDTHNFSGFGVVTNFSGFVTKDKRHGIPVQPLQPVDLRIVENVWCFAVLMFTGCSGSDAGTVSVVLVKNPSVLPSTLYFC